MTQTSYVNFGTTLLILSLLINVFLVNASTETSQSCSTLSHAVSMPVLTCPNCLQYRQDVDKLLSNNAELKKELKLSKAALEASLKSERSLRDRLVQIQIFFCLNIINYAFFLQLVQFGGIYVIFVPSIGAVREL